MGRLVRGGKNRDRVDAETQTIHVSDALLYRTGEFCDRPGEVTVLFKRDLPYDPSSPLVEAPFTEGGFRDAVMFQGGIIEIEAEAMGW